MKKIMALAVYLFSFTLVYGQSFDQLKIKLENCIQENDIPGAAIAVVTRDSVLFARGFGYANIQKKIPVTENTHFWIGSITKSFTALGIIKLAEQGMVDLNVPLKEILPDIIIQNPWQDTDPVRLVHLLEHTAGICDGLSTTFNWRHEPNIPLKEAMQLYEQIAIHHRPGSFYLYSNIGYFLAGMVIEKLTEMNYEQFLKREFLIPLGMNTTTFDPNDSYSSSVMAQGYGAGGKEIPRLYIYQRPAGHTYSPVSEMSQYIRFYLNYGKTNGLQILKPEYLKMMETPHTSLASRIGLLNGYGLGNEWAFRNQHKWRGHNGAGFGFYSDLWYNRELDIGYVVLINQFDAQTARNVRKLRELIAEHLTQNINPVFQPIISVPKEQLREYCGTYTIGYGAKDPLGLINYINGMTEVQLSGDTLFLNQLLSGDKEHVFPVSRGLFRKQDLPEPTVAFFTTPDGAKAMVNGRDYLEELNPSKYWLTIVFLIWSILVMFSTVIYAFFWVPVSVFKKVSKRQQVIHGITVKILPLLAIMVLTTGIILISNQELYFLGKLSFGSVSFFISTWIFAILAIVSFISAIRYLKQPERRIFRILHMVTACTYTGLALFLWYWGLIGLKLWI